VRKRASEARADTIIPLLEDLDLADISRVVEAAVQLRSARQISERNAFVARVREEAAALGLVPEQLFLPVLSPSRKFSRKRKDGAIPVKFRGPNGQEWSGRGKSPKWLSELERQGRTRDEFRIGEPQPVPDDQSKHERGKAA
jgi:DNA-binding protein H-NS